MSLDIYIISPEPIKKKSTGIYARIDGQTRELTIQMLIQIVLLKRKLRQMNSGTET